MTAQHTHGRASLDTKGVGIDLPNHIPIDIGQHAAAAQVVWKMEDYERSPHCEETARRLVACLNACEGISTEALEGDDAPRKLREDRDLLLAQRDELLEALIAMESRFGCWSSRQEDQPKTFGCRHTAETCTQCEGLVTGWRAVQAAREAIAKVTGQKGGAA
jgi:hypothetical protein